MKIDELAELMGITREKVEHILRTNDMVELNLTSYSEPGRNFQK